jgi:1-acyl-sn-glycerol-3-phosphate acyltransferase
MTYWIKINQLCLWFLTRLYLLITFSKRNVYLQADSLDNNHGYVVAGNHHRYIDPFIMFGAMPFRVIFKLIPVRFMAYRELFEGLPTKILLRATGAFPTKEINGLGYGLPFSTEVLAQNGTIVIFPEGQRVKPGEFIKAKRGVSVLAAEPNVNIIMCRLRWHKGRSPRITITISEPKDCSGWSAQQIMDQIYKLP